MLRYILMEHFLPLHHNLTFILYLHPYGCLLQVKLIFIGLPVRATTNEEMRSEFFYNKKRRNSGQNSQKALGIPLPFQWGQLRLVWYLNDFTDPILKHNCITVENSPNVSSVYIRLCEHREKVFYCFYKITFPRKDAKFFVWHWLKEKFLPVAKPCPRSLARILSSCFAKRCFPKYGLFSQKMSA